MKQIKSFVRTIERNGDNMFFWDSTYILVIIGVVLCLIAQARVKTTFSKYSRVRSTSGYTGRDAAEKLLHSQGIYDVRIERVSGELTDHYDPRTKVLRLSDSVYNQSSVAAIGVAAHECGHALQHAKGYSPLTLRGALVPIANFGANICWPLIVLGLFLGHFFITLGIIVFSASVLFQIVTLPVEFNASSRAVRLLGSTGILYGEELNGTKKVLKAAALTYVAGAASAILQLLRLVILFGGRNRD